MKINVEIDGFSTAKSFLEKMAREIKRLEEAQLYGSKCDVLDHGLNAAITGWHLHEAIAKEQSINKDKYRDDMKSLCADLALLHDIATQAKHFQVSNSQQVSTNDTLNINTNTLATFTDSEQKYVDERLNQNPEEAVYIRMGNRLQIVLKIEDRKAQDILNDIYKFWEKQLVSNDI